MKKIIYAALLSVSFAASAQYSADNQNFYGANSANGYSTAVNFPDDYYYDYPADYYSNRLYLNYYNDYRNSIASVDWHRLFRDFQLNRYQIRDITYLNNLFPDFYSWNQYYRNNPDRWYYDRFYALERILGPRAFAALQNRYYSGYSPVAYFEDCRERYYPRRSVIVQKYRDADPRKFFQSRNQFYRNRQFNGFNDVYSRFQEDYATQSEVFPHHADGQRDHGGFAGSTVTGTKPESGFRSEPQNSNSQLSQRNSGFRDGSLTAVSSNNTRREETVNTIRTNSGGGFR